MNPIHVALLFGGKSPEHDISIRSARNIYAALDRDQYEITLIGISRRGSWFHVEEEGLFADLEIGQHGQPLLLAPGSDSPIRYAHSGQRLPVEVVFPVTHGPMGEDGSLQGLLRHLDLPFVGPGVLASAAAMDKDVTKRLLKESGLLVAEWLSFQAEDRQTIDFHAVANRLGLPLFVKPANMGSSVGVSRADSAESFYRALDLAFQYDTKVLVEEAIVGRELECAVMGNDIIAASGIGEVGMASAVFYDYEAKYESEDAATILIPAPNLDQEQLAKLVLVAKSAYRSIGCEGLTRVDMFLTEEGAVYVNELNTLPGFTSISMYPKLWEVAGLGYGELLDELISLARARHQREQALSRHR